MRAVDSCLTALVAVWGRCNDAWVAVIGSRDARTFLDRGSRLPDALIISASRPIKHCTKHCPRRSSRSAEDNIQGRCSFMASGVFGFPRSKLSASENVAATKIYETLTSAQPSSVFRVSKARVSSLESPPAPVLCQIRQASRTCI